MQKEILVQRLLGSRYNRQCILVARSRSVKSPCIDSGVGCVCIYLSDSKRLCRLRKNFAHPSKTHHMKEITNYSGTCHYGTGAILKRNVSNVNSTLGLLFCRPHLDLTDTLLGLCVLGQRARALRPTVHQKRIHDQLRQMAKNTR